MTGNIYRAQWLHPDWRNYTDLVAMKTLGAGLLIYRECSPHVCMAVFIECTMAPVNWCFLDWSQVASWQVISKRLSKEVYILKYMNNSGSLNLDWYQSFGIGRAKSRGKGKAAQLEKGIGLWKRKYGANWNNSLLWGNCINCVYCSACSNINIFFLYSYDRFFTQRKGLLRLIKNNLSS